MDIFRRGHRVDGNAEVSEWGGREMSDNPHFIPLKRGETYTVDDIHGMLCFEAIYRGVVKDKNLVNVAESRLLLFEKNDSGSRWVGALAVPNITDSGISICLVAHYYGKTPRSLKRWNASWKFNTPKWVREKATS